MIDYKFDIAPRLNGNWGDFLTYCGLTLGKFKGKETKGAPCPLCGGKDRAHYRHKDDRIILCCRQCGSHSPESVIMEFNGWQFGDFAKTAAQYLGIDSSAPAKPVERVKVVKDVFSYKDCKNDHKGCMEWLSKADYKASFPVLLGCSVQHPSDLPISKRGFPVFPVHTPNGDVVNLAEFTGNETRFFNGVPSAGCFHEVKGSDDGDPVNFSNPVDALRHYWGSGCKATVRVWFDLELLAAAYTTGHTQGGISQIDTNNCDVFMP